MLDYFMGGQGFGSVAATLIANNFDPCALRPFIGPDGRSYIAAPVLNAAGMPVINEKTGKPERKAQLTANANALLRVREWIELDQAVVKVAKNRLRAVADFRAAGLTYTMDGFGKTVLQTERQSDVNPAIISMSGVRKGENDRPEYDVANLPLPIIHADFQMDSRSLATSRNGNSPLDTSMAELKARRCAEQAEALLLGTYGTYTFGGGTVYGMTNFPQRITKTLTNPTSAGWTPATLIDEILDMKLASQLAFHYGPWMCYNSPNWDKFLDADYSAAKGDNTLRDRIGKIQDIDPPRTLDNLTGYQIILVQKSTDVARIIDGMQFTTMQWETEGGLLINFKILGIIVPQFRADMNNNTGVVHGTAP